MVDILSIGEVLISRYCLDEACRWFIAPEEPVIYDNPLREMILHLGTGELWGLYEGVSIPSLAVDIDPLNLDKRTRAIIDLIACPGKTEKYILQMASELQIRCINAGRSDLADGISEAKSLWAEESR